MFVALEDLTLLQKSISRFREIDSLNDNSLDLSFFWNSEESNLLVKALIYLCFMKAFIYNKVFEIQELISPISLSESSIDPVTSIRFRVYLNTL